MALVRYGGGIVQMSGSIAGDTFARNRYGNYARARTKPINPNTNDQNAVRAAVAMLTERWIETLTALQRTAWGLYASNVVMKNRLGESVHLTGFNHYIRSNANRARWGFATIDDGPVVFELPDKDPAFAFTASEATQNFTIAYNAALEWANETGGSFWLQGGLPQNVTRNFYAGPWRRILRISGADGAPPASPHVTNNWIAIAEGQRIWLRGRIERKDARISEPMITQVIVGA